MPSRYTMLPTVRIGRKTSSQMNLEKSSLILVLLMVGGDCQLSTVCRLPSAVCRLSSPISSSISQTVWQSGRLSVCQSVSLTVSMSFSRAMYTHHVRAYSGATATTHYVFTHTHSHTHTQIEGRGRGSGTEADSCLSGNVYSLPSVRACRVCRLIGFYPKPI